MRIVKVDIPKDIVKWGLKPIKMDRLGQIVLLAGKNGSGKSRVLRQLSSTISKKPVKSSIKNAENFIPIYKAEIAQLERDNNLSQQRQTRRQRIGTLPNKDLNRLRIADLEKQIKIMQGDLEWNYVSTDILAENYSPINFVPKQVILQDTQELNRGRIYTEANLSTIVGTEDLWRATIPKIQLVQDRWWNATHQSMAVNKDEIDIATQDYSRLNALIKIFLDVELSRNLQGDAVLFGFPLGQASLSDGQKILLQFITAIHCQQQSLDELILFMDEPENHLHPSVIIDIIERLKAHTTKGQIWIATHSIPLLSYFDPNCIWFVEDGQVSHAGKIPEKVLQSLLGDENRIAKLQDFTGLPGLMALNRHAFESLFHPDAVTTDKSDPQPLQIREEIKQHLKENMRIRVLDYGVGKGRLLSNILENSTEPIESFREWFDYIAFDKFNTDAIECKSVIKKLYENSDERYFNDWSKLLGVYDKESFDIVIMCNVLHELDPNEWIDILGNRIPELLSEKGILLLVEDHEMPIGEKAYQKGFIVLDTADLKDLFKIKESDKDFGFSDARGDGRLKAHRIPKRCLKNITQETKRAALQNIRQHAMDKIIEIREGAIDYKNGKRHGFWIQQLANTTLALREQIKES